MKNHYYARILLLCLFVLISILGFSQKRSYLFTGIEAEVFEDSEPLSNIINDFNTYHSEFDISIDKRPIMPMYIPGFMIGFKIHAWFSTFGANAHFVRYTTQACGVNLDCENYDESIQYYHNGLSVYYHINWINTNYFRTGPGIGIMLDQFKLKITDDTQSEYNTTFPVDRALILGRLYYAISIGGPKFNLDLIGFYNIPLNTLNLSVFNERLNSGYYTEYDSDILEFNPTVYGISVCIGLGSRDNYDF